MRWYPSPHIADGCSQLTGIGPCTSRRPSRPLSGSEHSSVARLPVPWPRHKCNAALSLAHLRCAFPFGTHECRRGRAAPRNAHASGASDTHRGHADQTCAVGGCVSSRGYSDPERGVQSVCCCATTPQPTARLCLGCPGIPIQGRSRTGFGSHLWVVEFVCNLFAGMCCPSVFYIN